VRWKKPGFCAYISVEQSKDRFSQK